MQKGLYEQVVNRLTQEIQKQAEEEKLFVLEENLDPEDSHIVLANYLAECLRQSFRAMPATERIDRQLGAANRIIKLAFAQGALENRGSELKIVSPKILLQITDSQLLPPDTPLTQNCLFTGTQKDPTLASQLLKELQTADELDILCSFIRWSGTRILLDGLKSMVQRGGKVRIITTTYMGATDAKAIETLSALQNTSIRVSYDSHRTRLHAKAYVFRRLTGFGSAYVGSANISEAALTEGLEWVVKISQKESTSVWEKISGTFETYFNDREFEPFSIAEKDRLRIALQGEKTMDVTDETRYYRFQLRPYYFQSEILDKLTAEREIQNRWRNLVVSATGTGKTMVAAFDFARFREAFLKNHGGTEPRLLFVAHREEILKQSRATFRAVLGNFNFGSLLVGENKPDGFDHLFVSIQSYNSQNLHEVYPSDHYDYVIVDEFHHAAAPSYRRLLDFIRPVVLLGLTATPERSDQLDILGYFDGHVAAEIRLPDAIGRKLLCPFQYFAVTDPLDLSTLRWTRGGYDKGELEKLVTGNDIRAQLVISKVHEILKDPHNGRGLGFCVSMAHAKYMAEVFTKAGIPSRALTADSPPELRRTVQKDLVERKVNFIFTVDLYNEGVDIPEVDAVLFLRPTESLTVFLQQLGRGLRLTSGKECLTALDFVGQAHKNFRFEERFRALLGSSQQIEKEINEGFPHLPPGCTISLERVAKEHILENIRQSLSANSAGLIRRIQIFSEESGKALSLGAFCDFFNIEIDDIYRRGSWSRLCVRAGVGPTFAEPNEEQLTKGLRRIEHIGGQSQIEKLLKILNATGRAEDNVLSESEQKFLLMMHFSLWGKGSDITSIKESLAVLKRNPVMTQELKDLLRYRYETLPLRTISPEGEVFAPLELHASYTRDEILAALGVWNLNAQREVREGVLWLEKAKVDVFFVTLVKTEKDYSPSTMYDDYAISESLFHWQSQSTTSENSPTGRRYVHHKDMETNVLLFVRAKKQHNGLACPYSFLGPIEYQGHEGSRPMSITWQVKYPMPARFLRTALSLAG